MGSRVVLRSAVIDSEPQLCAYAGERGAVGMWCALEGRIDGNVLWTMEIRMRLGVLSMRTAADRRADGEVQAGITTRGENRLKQRGIQTSPRPRKRVDGPPRARFQPPGGGIRGYGLRRKSWACEALCPRRVFRHQDPTLVLLRIRARKSQSNSERVSDGDPREAEKGVDRVRGERNRRIATHYGMGEYPPGAHGTATVNPPGSWGRD